MHTTTKLLATALLAAACGPGAEGAIETSGQLAIDHTAEWAACAEACREAADPAACVREWCDRAAPEAR